MNINTDNKNNYDICIIGGGINGAGIANEASKIGLKVYLCEKNDFASQTSSSSTKLIHGGLRYLENYDFKLVRAALKERSNLHKIGSHIIKPLDFILIHNPRIRNRYLVRVGLFLYDLLAGINNKYKISKTIKLYKDYQYKNDLSPKVNNSGKKIAFRYSDLWVDDSRLTILNIVAAKKNGAVVNKNTELVSAQYDLAQEQWQLLLLNKNKNHIKITAKIIINAAGPWVNNVLTSITSEEPNHEIRLVKGSHIVVPKIYDGSHCYVLQHKDNRIIFTIPYNDDYTLIGTTEENYKINDLNKSLKISNSESEYLLNLCNSFFKKTINQQDIVWTYSGIRPLVNQSNKSISGNTRDYYIEQYHSKLKKTGPLINIYGGKITTYRVLAKKIIKILSKIFNLNNFSKQELVALPGANLDIFHDKQYEKNLNYQDYYISNIITKYPWLPMSLVKRYACTYGLLAEQFLQQVDNINDLGLNFGADLYAKELDYLINYEFADTAEDVIWRRTKLGLKLSQAQIQMISDYINHKVT